MNFIIQFSMFVHHIQLNIKYMTHNRMPKYVEKEIKKKNQQIVKCSNQNTLRVKEKKWNSIKKPSFHPPQQYITIIEIFTPLKPNVFVGDFNFSNHLSSAKLHTPYLKSPSIQIRKLAFTCDDFVGVIFIEIQTKAFCVTVCTPEWL